MLATYGNIPSSNTVVLATDFAAGFPKINGFFYGNNSFYPINIEPNGTETAQEFANRIAAEFTQWLESIYGEGCTSSQPLTITATTVGLNIEFALNDFIINTGQLPLPITQTNALPAPSSGSFGIGWFCNTNVNPAFLTVNQNIFVNVRPCGEDSTPLNCPESWESHNRKLAERYANR